MNKPAREGGGGREAMMARRKFRVLRDLIDDAELSQGEVAEKIGRGHTYFSARMTAEAPFDMEDILRLAELLEIPPEDWVRVFVADYANTHYPGLLQPAAPWAV